MGGLRFDLPATEGSLAGKTLGQLKLTSLRIVPRAGVCVCVWVLRRYWECLHISVCVLGKQHMRLLVCESVFLCRVCY